MDIVKFNPLDGLPNPEKDIERRIPLPIRGSTDYNRILNIYKKRIPKGDKVTYRAIYRELEKLF